MKHVCKWAFSIYFPYVYCKCGKTMAVEEANARLNKYEILKAENEALREYALGLMMNSYHGASREERKLILESELIALLADKK